MKLHWDTCAFYPVERVMKWRFKINDKGALVHEFLVKWKNHSHFHDSWEEYFHLDALAKTEADDLIRSGKGELLVVEKITKTRWMKKRGNGAKYRPRRKEYFIDWRGHPKSDSKWVTLAELKKMKGEALYKMSELERILSVVVKTENP